MNDEPVSSRVRRGIGDALPLRWTSGLQDKRTFEAEGKGERLKSVRAIAVVYRTYIISAGLAFSAVLMLAIGSRAYVKAVLSNEVVYPHDALFMMMKYARMTLSVNYMNAGFVRRGLLGTISLLLPYDYVVSGMAFSFLLLIWAATAFLYIFYRLSRQLPLTRSSYLMLIAVLSPQLFQNWAHGLAFPDMFVVGTTAWAAIATVSRRPRLGVCLIWLGLLAHETAVIFGLPLLFVLNLLAYREGEQTSREALTVMAVSVVGVISIELAQAMSSLPPSAIAAHMLQSTQNAPLLSSRPVELSRELAVYFQTSGIRGVSTAICINLFWTPQYVFTAGACLAIIGVYAFVLPIRRAYLSYAGAVILPFLAITLVAQDSGRWLGLAVANAWLFSAMQQLRTPSPEPVSVRTMAVGGVLFAGLLAMGHATYNQASSATHAIELAMGLPDETDDLVIDRCDPSWRSVVFGRGAPLRSVTSGRR